MVSASDSCPLNMISTACENFLKLWLDLRATSHTGEKRHEPGHGLGITLTMTLEGLPQRHFAFCGRVRCYGFEIGLLRLQSVLDVLQVRVVEIGRHGAQHSDDFLYCHSAYREAGLSIKPSGDADQPWDALRHEEAVASF